VAPKHRLVRENAYRDVWLLIITGFVVWAMFRVYDVAQVADATSKVAKRTAIATRHETRQRRGQTCVVFERMHQVDVVQLRSTYAYVADLSRGSSAPASTRPSSGSCRSPRSARGRASRRPTAGAPASALTTASSSPSRSGRPKSAPAVRALDHHPGMTPRPEVTKIVRNQSSRNGIKPKLIVLHSTESKNVPGLSDLQAIGNWFDNPKPLRRPRTPAMTPRATMPATCPTSARRGPAWDTTLYR
jgi:hypothetical protein